MCRGRVIGGMGGGRLIGSQLVAMEWGGEVRLAI